MYMPHVHVCAMVRMLSESQKGWSEAGRKDLIVCAADTLPDTGEFRKNWILLLEAGENRNQATSILCVPSYSGHAEQRSTIFLWSR